MANLLHTALLISSVFAMATACKDGTLEAIEETRCSHYAECEGGTWYLKECGSGQVFDSKTLKCAPVTNEGICSSKVSKCSEGRTYSHPGSRRMYYRCINGRVLRQSCRVGEVFHPDSQHCQVDEEFRYPGLKRPQRNMEEACKEGSRRRNGKSCKDYVECFNGHEVNRTCAECMNYDDKSETCLFVFFSPCPYTPTPAPITTPKPQPDPTTQETKTDAPTTTPQPDPTTQETKTDAPTTPPQPDPTTQETKTDAPTTPPQPDPTTQETKTDAPTTTPQSDPTTQETKTEAPTTNPQPDTTTTESPTSPVAPCKEGDKVGLVDPECKAYKECKHGVWVHDSCWWFREFDAIKKECEFYWFHKITCAS